MIQVLDAQAVRDYMNLNSPASSSQYSDGTIGSNILAAQSILEKITGRYFGLRTFTTQVPWQATTMLRAIVPLPGLSNPSQIVWSGSVVIPNQGCWLLPDSQQSGVYTGIQFRAFRGDASGAPWWYANSEWWDKSLDSPYFPGNYGGGYFYTSMPNDLTITGDFGYTADLMPWDYLHAVKVLAGFYTERPQSILADVTITPAGGVLNYSQMPAEVQRFIAEWKGGVSNQMVSAG